MKEHSSAISSSSDVTCCRAIAGSSGCTCEAKIGDQVRTLVGSFRRVFSAPPGDVLERGCDLMRRANGPLLGNGRVAIELSGPPDDQRWHICKNDFWTHNSALVLNNPTALTVGGVTLDVVDLLGSSYHQEQDIYAACVAGSFAKNNQRLDTRSWICRKANLLVIELRNEGLAEIGVQAAQWAGDPRPAIPARAGLIEIGHWRTYNGQICDQFCGRIRDVHLYSACLSPSQVAAVRDGSAGAPMAAAFWPMTDEEEQTQGLCKVEAPAMSDVSFSITVWLNPETDESVRVARKRQQYCQCTARCDADAQYVASHSGSPHGDYNLSLVNRRPHFKIWHHQALAVPALPKGQWSHVAATFDGSAIAIYVNGEKVPVLVADKIEQGGDAQSLWFRRWADVHHPAGQGRVVSVVTRVLGATPSHMDGRLGFALAPGQAATVVTAILSDRDAPKPLDAAQTMVCGLSDGHIRELRAEHENWWRAFWAKSFVDVHEPTAHANYYGSLYATACFYSEDMDEVPTGICSMVTTDEPAWSNDFHLNYNYQSPLWGLYGANRVELTATYDGPILDYMEKARANVRKMGFPGALQDYVDKEEAEANGIRANRGVLYPVCIGPWGLDVQPVFWGQKINAAHCAINMLMRYYSTYDLDYARRIYPFVIEVANFWEDYLRVENSRYVFYHDSVREQPLNYEDPKRPLVPQKNNTFALALVPKVLQGAIDLSVHLGVDAGRREKWLHIIENMHPYPIMIGRDDKLVFRLEEEGLDEWSHWALRMQHIWPSGGIGLDSPKLLVEIARNTADMPGHGFRPLALGYPPLARIGYDPAKLLKMLASLQVRTNCLLDSFDGSLFIENSSVVPATLNEMLLQSYEGVLRLFPLWPKDTPARFYRLRAYGAFLVTAEWADGGVKSARIESEMGQRCRLQDPWSGRGTHLVDETTGTELTPTTDPNHSDYLIFNTEKGHCYRLEERTP